MKIKILSVTYISVTFKMILRLEENKNLLLWEKFTGKIHFKNYFVTQ